MIMSCPLQWLSRRSLPIPLIVPDCVRFGQINSTHETPFISDVGQCLGDLEFVSSAGNWSFESCHEVERAGCA